MGASCRSAQENYSQVRPAKAEHGDGNLTLRRDLIALITKEAHKADPYLRGGYHDSGDHPERADDWRISS